MRLARFCPRCAGALVRRIPELDSRLRNVCGACGFVLYMNPKVAAGTVPEHEGRIALIRRGVEPGIGLLSFPCGYQEIDETVEQCAVRETHEETGLEVTLGRFLGIYSYPADEGEGAAVGTGIVVVAWSASVASATLVAGDDALEAAWYAPEDVPWADLAFDSSRRALHDHFGLAAGSQPSCPEA